MHCTPRPVDAYFRLNINYKYLIYNTTMTLSILFTYYTIRVLCIKTKTTIMYHIIVQRGSRNASSKWFVNINVWGILYYFNFGYLLVFLAFFPRSLALSN